MNILQYGGGGGSGLVDFAIVRNTVGQVCAPSDVNALNIDEIGHLGPSFDATVGHPLVSLAPGVYLAMCGIRAEDAALTSGYMLGWPWANYIAVSLKGSCMSGASSTGEAVGLGLITAAVADVAWMYSQHTNVGDIALAGELVIVRLGPL